MLDLHRNRGLRGWLLAITGLVLGALGCFAIALLNRDILSLSAFLALCIGFAVLAVGWIHGCLTASNERPMWGFLAALIPIFWLWYCITRWRRCWPHLVLVVVIGYPTVFWAIFQLGSLTANSAAGPR